MRILEILILVSLLCTIVILYFAKKDRRSLIFSSIITATVLLCHLFFEGSRWQMVPAYLFAAILFPISLGIIFRRVRREPGSSSLAKRLLRATGILFTFLLLLLISIPPILLPVFKLPEPTGPNAIGSTTMFFRDSSRLDPHSGETEKYREVSVRAWYPAILEGDEKSMPYMNKSETRYMAQHFNMPPFFMGHFNLVKTDSYHMATPLEGTCPVVFYSPSGDMVQNTALFQELASHGYIVFSVCHPYWNAFCYDSNGQSIPFDNENEYYRSMWDEENSDSVNAIKEEITSAPNLEMKRIAQKKLNLYMPLEIADVRLWSEDISFLLDQLTDPELARDWLVKHIDADRAGVIGFSKGGSAAGQFSVTDSRCRAGINLSGFMFGDAVERKIPVPFMILENVVEWCEECAPICGVFYEDAQSDVYMVRIEGARHGNFSDWSLVGGFLRISGMTGPINGHRFLEIQNQYVVSFFDRYLKGADAPLMNGSGPDYPEVAFESRNRY